MYKKGQPIRIGVIGHLGGNNVFNDGQTVKTVTLYNALRHSDLIRAKVHAVDTYQIRHNLLAFLWRFFICALLDKKIIILLAENGRKVLFPVLYILAKVFKKEIYHYAIGGRLAHEVFQNPKWRKYVNSFQTNWMESIELVNNLRKLGVLNAEYMPNFKSIRALSDSELKNDHAAPYRFCIFSRIVKEKGVLDAIDAIRNVNSELGQGTAELDIYGPIEPGFENEFYGALKEAKESCRYCGVVDANQSVDVLKDYYMLLFPTHFRYEGIPGTIIDAFAAGLPVIARRWQYCDEMIEHGKNGRSYDFDKPEKLFDEIMYAIENQGVVDAMRVNCLVSASKFSEESVMERIIDRMNLKKAQR